MTVEEKLNIARGMVTPLLRKIRAGKLSSLEIMQNEMFFYVFKIFNRI